jgi:cobalamin biosynthesis protein CobD/CbiB
MLLFVIGACVFGFWFSKQRDQLSANYRLWGIVMWSGGVCVSVAWTIAYFKPNSVPMTLTMVVTLLVVIAIFQRKRLAQELRDR